MRTTQNSDFVSHVKNGNQLIVEGNVAGTFSVSNGILSIDTGNEVTNYQEVTELSQQCAFIDSQISSTPPNYEGIWYSSQFDEHYKINEDFSVQYCYYNPDVENVFLSTGMVNGNLLVFSFGQAVMSLANETISITFPDFLSSDFLKVQTASAECEQLFDGN